MILFILFICCLPLLGINIIINLPYLFVSPATILLLDKQVQFQKTVIIEDNFTGAAIIQ